MDRKGISRVAALLLGATLGVAINCQPGDDCRILLAAEQDDDPGGGKGGAPAPANAKAEVPDAKTEAQGGVPKLKIDEATFDFGEREPTEKVAHTFIIRNVGSAPLEIKWMSGDRAFPVELSARRIAPGEKAELTATWDLTGRRGYSARSIAVITNDRTAFNARVGMVGIVVPRLKVDPYRLEFGDEIRTGPVSKTFKVTGERGLTFDIVKTQASEEAVTGDVKVVKAGKEFEVTVTVKAPLKAERGWFFLKTDQTGEYSHVFIPIVPKAPKTTDKVVKPAGEKTGTPAPATPKGAGAVAEAVEQSELPKLKIDDATFDFGEREPTDQVTHTFIIRNVGTALLEIKKLSADRIFPVEKMSAWEIAPGETAELTATLDLAGLRGRTARQIVVWSNDRTARNAMVKFVGFVAPRAKLDPPRFDLGDEIRTGPVTKTFKVTGELGLSFDIVKTKTSEEGVTADVKVVKAGKEFEVTVTVKTPLKDGRGWVFLDTDQPGEYERILIPIYGETPAAKPANSGAGKKESAEKGETDE